LSDLNIQDMIDEIRYNITRQDSLKARILLSYLDRISEKDARRILFEMSRADADFRIRALAAVMLHHPDTASAVPAIRETLIAALLDYPEKIATLLEQSAKPERHLYIRLAGEIRVEAAVPALLDILADAQEQDTIAPLLTALGLIGDPAATNVLTDYMYSANRDLIVEAVQALGSLGTPTAMHRLAERMGTDNELDRMILEIFANVQDVVSLEKLNGTLRSHYAQMRNYAKSVLVQIGSKAVPLLIENLKNEDPDLLIHTLNVLADIGDPSTIVPIRKLLNTHPKDPNIRFAAYEALSFLPLHKGAYMLADGLRDPVEHVRIVAARAIDRNYNDILTAGIKNLVRSDDKDARTLVKTVVDAQADRILLSLAEEPVFLKLAVEPLARSHPDIRSHYIRLLTRHGHTDLATRVEKMEQVGMKKLKICVVDDSRMILNVYKTSLHELGYEPVLFEFPAGALDWLEKEAADILLTDLNMPEITGIDLAARVKKIPAHENLPIVMVTTQNESQDNQAAYTAGVNEIIHKPFTRESLATVISKYTSG